MRNKQWKKWSLIGGMAAAIFLAGNLFHPTVVVGQSMSPTLKPGKMILVDQTYYATHTPQRGEVIIFKEGKDTYVKRIFRGPGEIMHYVASDGDWLGPVRDDKVSALRAFYRKMHSSLQVRTMRVPDDSVFVLGDNYLCSVDSRQLGPIPMSSVIGRAHVAVDETKADPYEFTPRVHFTTSAKAGKVAGKHSDLPRMAGI